MRNRQRILFVTSQLIEFGDDGGIATVCSNLVELLSRSRHDIFVLYPEHVEPEALEEARRRFTRHLSRMTIETFARGESSSAEPDEHKKRSQAIYDYVLWCRPDLVIFNDAGGDGFCTVQAKVRSQMAAKTCVLFHGPTRWISQWHPEVRRHRNFRAKDRRERFTVQNADHVIFPTRWAKRWAQQNDFQPRHKKWIQPFPVLVSSSKSPRDQANHPAVIFWGRLEERKGLRTFLRAIEKIDTQVPTFFDDKKIVLMGPPTFHFEGQYLGDVLSDWSEHNGHVLHHLRFREANACLDFIRRSSGLAVIASEEETMGCTFFEALQAGIRFIASDIDPFREFGLLNPRRFFRSQDPDDLARKILKFSHLKAEKPRRIAWEKLWGKQISCLLPSHHLVWDADRVAESALIRRRVYSLSEPKLKCTIRLLPSRAAKNGKPFRQMTLRLPPPRPGKWRTRCVDIRYCAYCEHDMFHHEMNQKYRLDLGENSVRIEIPLSTQSLHLEFKSTGQIRKGAPALVFRQIRDITYG